jgi:GNAT superfamily N-acetyltransferase
MATPNARAAKPTSSHAAPARRCNNNRKVPMNLTLRALKHEDCESIAHAFAAQRWHKPVELYARYFRQQTAGERDMILAEVDDRFAGYLTIEWRSHYLPFKEADIPEITDFNVLIALHRRGIGTRLMDEAERRIARVSAIAGIGVGMTPDYGPAHMLYIRRGYVPDGRGLWYDNRPLKHGDPTVVDDSLTLYHTKHLA